MRPFLALTAALVCSSISDAADVASIEKHIEGKKVEFKFRLDSGDGYTLAAETGPARIDYAGPGKLTYIRDNNGESLSYAIRISEVHPIAVKIPLETKFSSCESVKPATRCELQLKFTQVQYALDPLNGTPPAPKVRKVLDLFETDFDFIARHFPELASANSVTLKCNDWSWASAKNDSVEIEEFSLSSTMDVKDLNRSVTRSSSMTGHFTCQLKSGKCVLNKAVRKFPLFPMVFGVASQASYSIETVNENSTCTTEFQGTTNGDIIGIVNEGLPQLPPEYNSPEMLRRLQLKLNEDFLQAYQKLRLESLITGGFFNNQLSFAELLVLKKFTWLELLNLIDADASSEQGCSNENECTRVIQVKDTFLQEGIG